MRIVLLTRYFPPEISGGARRPFALAQAWRALGAEVTIVAPLGADDEGVLGVPHPSFPASPDIGASQKMTREPFGNMLRKAILLPDPEVRWALRASNQALEAAKSADWIVTTSPPESLHLAGALLKAKTSALWLADVRDLWLSDPQLAIRKHPLRRWIETPLAKAILSRCDAISAVSPVVLAEAMALSGHKKPNVVLPHFAAPFSGEPEILPPETFNIVHTGAVGLSNPLSEFACLLADFEALHQDRPNAALWLAGHLSDQELGMISASPAAANVRVLGPVTMARARALQLGADALALVSGRQSHALPGKFSEYQLTGLPILMSAIGPWTALLPCGHHGVQFEAGRTLTKADTHKQKASYAEPNLAAGQLLLDLMQSVQANLARS